MILLIVYFLLLSVLIFQWRFFRESSIPQWLVLSLWIIKVLAGFSVLWVYQVYYGGHRNTGDVFKYFDDAEVLYRSFLAGHYTDFFSMLTGYHASSSELMRYYADTDFWFKHFNYGLLNENRTMIRINLFLRLFSGGNIYVHSLFFSFFAFIGSWALFKALVSFFQKKEYLLLSGILLIPSVLFWSSSIMKETLIIAELGFLVFFLINKKYFGVFVFLGMLFFTKIYVFAALLPGVVSFFMMTEKDRLLSLKVVGVHLGFLLLVWLSSFSPYNIVEIIANKQNDFINMVQQVSAGSAFEMNRLQPHFFSIMQQVPAGFFNGLLRPLPSDVHNAFGMMAVAENGILVFFLLVLLFFFRRSHKSIRGIEMLLLSFSFILIILVGLTTPVAGAIVRYRIPSVLFLFVIMLYHLDTQRLFEVLKRFNPLSKD